MKFGGTNYTINGTYISVITINIWCYALIFLMEKSKQAPLADIAFGILLLLMLVRGAPSGALID